MITGKSTCSLKVLLFSLVVSTTLVYLYFVYLLPRFTEPVPTEVYDTEWNKMWAKFDKGKKSLIPDYIYSNGDEEPYVHIGPLHWDELPEKVREDMTLGWKIRDHQEYLEYNQNGVLPTQTWDYQIIEHWKKIAIDNNTCHQQPACQCYIRAFKEFPVKDKKVIVLGSFSAWQEAIALAHGAVEVTSTDYNLPTLVGTKTIPLEVKPFYQLNDLYDVAFYFSSLEHDGLGRYGDPINPFGDFLRMKAIKNLLKENGLVFISVPIGKDRLSFNSHRIYGPVRFPLLIEGFKYLSFFPEPKYPTTLNESFQFDWDWHNKPVIVLQNVVP